MKQNLTELIYLREEEAMNLELSLNINVNIETDKYVKVKS